MMDAQSTGSVTGNNTNYKKMFRDWPSRQLRLWRLFHLGAILAVGRSLWSLLYR
jgi:hypothetical protein